jgi:signal transduction histidine kinase
MQRRAVLTRRVHGHPDAERLRTAVAALATMALENRRLVAELESSRRELSESRARIQDSADEERRRIERDLHDGAQQRLVGLRIKLELAQELIGRDPTGGRALLNEIGDDTIGALEDVRSLAHGVYPSLLARGLEEAIREATLRSPIPASFDARGVRRYPQRVESAVYFCCLEAMQNAAKHAGAAARIVVRLSDGGALRFEVRDDGVGFDQRVCGGAGLANMHDRMATAGGRLTVVSAAGEGTRVIGSVPVR